MYNHRKKMTTMNNIQYPLEELEQKIGYKFNDISLLRRAMTHSSYANEQRSKGIDCRDNERFEFLGDSVLSLITSESLFTTFPDKAEGDMSKIRAAAVCEKALDEYCAELSLGSYLYLGHGEEINGGRERPSMIADAFEALIAAVYLDGGFENVKRFLLPFVSKKIEKIIKDGSEKDHKTLLQQIVQQEQGEILQYVTVSETGPSHQKTFEVEARLNSNVIGRGVGSSKREAEQIAAKDALRLFGN